MTALYAPARLRRSGPLLLTAVSLLAWGNGVVPALPDGVIVRAVANVAGAAALLAAARSSGLSWAELGLGRGTGRVGLRWGAAGFVAVGGFYAALLAVAPGVLANAGVVGDDSEVLLRAVVLIPLGTVLAEEIAFRGVLHGVAARLLRLPGTLAVTSVTFGLWHVTTAAGAAGVAVSEAWRSPAVLGVVALTTAGGVLFGWVRHRTGSLLAPVGLHLGTNVLGLLAAVVALR